MARTSVLSHLLISLAAFTFGCMAAETGACAEDLDILLLQTDFRLSGEEQSPAQLLAMASGFEAVRKSNATASAAQTAAPARKAHNSSVLLALLTGPPNDVAPHHHGAGNLLLQSLPPLSGLALTSTALSSGGGDSLMIAIAVLAALVVMVALALCLYSGPSKAAGSHLESAKPLHKPWPTLPADQQGRFSPAAAAAGGISPAAAAAAQNAPPAICASLILPNTEARFVISMEGLLRMTTGTLDILGTSGRKLLHACVEDAPDGRRCLSLASVGCEADPRAVVSVGTQPGIMEVYGRGRRFYGTLEVAPGGAGCVLRCGGQPVMVVETGGLPDLRMAASTTDGRLLGTAGREAQRGSSGRGDAWKLQVKPGADAVLVSCAMLALVLLRGPPVAGPGAPSPALSPRGSAMPPGTGRAAAAAFPGVASSSVPPPPGTAPNSSRILPPRTVIMSQRSPAPSVRSSPPSAISLPSPGTSRMMPERRA